MMNMQNPAYPSQQAYAYSAGMAQPPHVPPSYPNEVTPNQFQQQQQQQSQFPTTPQRPGHFPQPGTQIPPHLYQQLQQQQQAQQLQQQQQGGGGFARPPSQGSSITQGQRQSPGNGQISNPQRSMVPQSNNSQSANMMGMSQQQALNNGIQQNQTQNINKGTLQTSQATPLSPQAITRERARVAILLEINSNLLQELVSLQNQGKAGAVQQSPTSPNSTNENFNSPVEAGKTGPSIEFKECIRRLQANLSYLAAVADAKKRSDGKVPPYPAILAPPTYLTSIHELYKKLSAFFPEAGQSATNKAFASGSAQQNQPNKQISTDVQV